MLSNNEIFQSFSFSKLPEYTMFAKRLQHFLHMQNKKSISCKIIFGILHG